MTDDPTKLLSMCGICYWPSSVCRCFRTTSSYNPTPPYDGGIDWENVKIVPPNPPETIKTGHLTWKLSVVPATEMPTEKPGYGCTDCARLTIFMQQGMPKPLQVDVVIHECLHAIVFAYGFPKKLREERWCLMLAGPLIALMRDNPQLVRWIQEQ